MAEQVPTAAVNVKRVKDSSSWLSKQRRNLEAVGQQNYTEGVVTPKRPIVATSIKAEPKYAAKMQKVIQEQARVAGLKGVTDDYVVGSAINIGAPKLVPGVTQRWHKVTNFVEKWQPILAAIQADVDSKPDVTDADRENRMLANLRGLKAKKRAWKA